MGVDVYESESGFSALRGEWNTLLRRSPTDTIFLTWEWQSLWWRAYHPGVLFIVAVRTDAGELIGIAPWFVETTTPGERVVRAIGCVDVTDYVDVIAAEEHFDTVLNTLAEVLADRAASFTRISLCNLRAASPTLASLQAALERAGFQAESVEQEVCPVIPLPDTFVAYIESLDKKNRHELRRKIRIAEGTGELSLKFAGADDDLESCIREFMSLMAESTEQKAAFLRDEQNGAFFRSILPAMAANGWLQLAFLNYENRPTAAYVNFVYNRRVMVYNSGLSLSHGHLSPGIILLAYLIRHAIENGNTFFDFLRGDEEYKFRLGGVPERLYMLRARLS